jgi:hypothetical protein
MSASSSTSLFIASDSSPGSTSKDLFPQQFPQTSGLFAKKFEALMEPAAIHNRRYILYVTPKLLARRDLDGAGTPQDS